jgi:hypothetical protein
MRAMSYCQRKQIKFCAEPKSWITNGGGYADYMIAEADGCTLLPDNLPWELAAPLFCGGFSAMGSETTGYDTNNVTNRDFGAAATEKLWKTLVDVRGLEPLTSSLRTRRSPN